MWPSSAVQSAGDTNVNGGAIAPGHPLGSTGAKLTTTLVHELVRRGARRGLIAICGGGGSANAILIARV
jgi:acetyl-CoA acetyltransferase